ncbi:MAG TPA: SEL1-like repeat protein, partial [Phenylobacterium sp.]|nr:SEL1-like repeat protein [Phenylobacterium sp.]
AASDLAERIRQSEERTARLLAEASQRLGAETPAAEAQAMDATDEIAPSPAAWSAVAEELPAAPAVFGAELFSRAESVSQPALDPGNPTFNEEDFAHVDAFAPEGFAPIAELDDEDRFVIDGPPEALDAAPEVAQEAAREATNAADGEPPVETVMELGVEPKGEDEAAAAARAAAQLSTRQVIEQARAAARAAAAAPRPRILHAPERRPRAMRAGGLFRSLKARPPSTWQTALMVAGGAAFLSVGAAGVVLMEGPNATREALPFAASPRAAVALTPDAALSASPLVAETKALSATPSTAAAPTEAAASPADAVGADYVKVAAAVEQKQPGALARLKAIADGGHAPAQMFLARLYETGQAGVVQNLGEARRWTMRAAEAGDPTAMHNLALYYFRGEGAPQDTAAAAQWFKKAAEHGVVDSQYNLGLLYQSGSGVPRDLAQAYKWFSIAANSGDGEARSSAIDLESKLPSAQLAQAESQASAFQPTGVTATPDTAASGASVASAQKILGRLGYYKGRPDGTNSRDMRLAVTAYQRDQGLAATGSLDPATVSRLSVFSR